MAVERRVAGSFRDPSGFLFLRDGELYRQVNHSYREDYDRLMASGLCQTLVEQRLLTSHEEVTDEPVEHESAYKLIKPKRVPFVSYPYEWCFNQLKDAALATLRIQELAMEKGMSLKDASAYNIQFLDGKPVLIDTLSFEQYREGRPWVAYRQFCQHFLAPLALMARRDVRLSQLLRVYIDGIPIDLAAATLPFSTRLSFGLLTHIHLHAKSQRRYADRRAPARGKLSKSGYMGIIDNLKSTVESLVWKPPKTEWGAYYASTNYSDRAMQAKAELIESLLRDLRPSDVWDLGANTGEFSRIAAAVADHTVAFDIDPVAVEFGYLSVKAAGEEKMLPLLLDLTNPSPAIGWRHQERMSLVQRGPVDLVLALALIHHIAISNNVPLEEIAAFFASICTHLIVEFVPKEDSQVQRLLATREDVFPNYTRQAFETVFERFFSIEYRHEVTDSRRTLYHMTRLAP